MAPPTVGPSVAALRASFEQAKRNVHAPADWLAVMGALQALRMLQPEDPYVIQQLALATYKSGLPNKGDALKAALGVLQALDPQNSSDGETVGLWGAIHKRLWEATKDPAALDEAIRAHERGFRIRNDHYNGINLAFLLNVRASVSAGDDAVADRVLATRVRRDVLAIAEQFLNAEQEQAAQASADKAAADGSSWEELRYWVRASRVEALFGLGRREDAELAFKEAKDMPPPQGWMLGSTQEQLDKLADLLGVAPLAAA